MLKNITHGEWQEYIEYELVFMFDSNSGYAFPCDADGNLLPMTPEAANNLEFCRSHPEKFVAVGEVVSHRQTWRDYDSGDCVCGKRVELVDEYYGACQCPQCGRWYNMFGQELLPPELWEDDPSEEEW